MRISLRYPSNLLIIVKKPNVPVDLTMFINHISLNFTLIVQLLSKFIDQILQIIKIYKKDIIGIKF